MGAKPPLQIGAKPPLRMGAKPPLQMGADPTLRGRLDAAAYETLLAGIDRVYEAMDDLDALGLAMVETVASVLACRHVVYNEVMPIEGRQYSVASRPETARLIGEHAEAGHRLLPTHPVLHHLQEHPDDAVVNLTDVVDHGEFRRTPLYLELFRALNSEYQIILNLRTSPEVSVALSMNRDEGEDDFDDEDRRLLEHLAPHFRRAYRIALGRRRLRLLLDDRITDEVVATLCEIGLTEREAEVLYWVIHGRSNREIAHLLHTSPLTVKTQVQSLLGKLDVGGRAEAVTETIRRVETLGPEPRA